MEASCHPDRTAWPRAEIQPPALTDVYTLLAKCVVGFQSAQGKGKLSVIGLPGGDAFFSSPKLWVLLAALGRSVGEWGAQELGILDMAAGGPHCSVGWSAFPGQQGWEEECSSVLRWGAVGPGLGGAPPGRVP